MSENVIKKSKCPERISSVMEDSGMWPLVRKHKDVVQLVPLKHLRPAGHLYCNDVIAIQKGSNLVARRIVEVHEDYYVTRGDNSRDFERVARTDVLALMVGMWRFGTYLSFLDLWYDLYLSFYLHFVLPIRRLLMTVHS